MNKEIISGIYSITNIINGKIYIGSSKDIYRRWKEHISHLNLNKHHSSHLQQAWNKYGKDNFNFKIIERCEENKLIFREQYYMDYYLSYDNYYGYNISEFADRPSGMSDEQRDYWAQIFSKRLQGEGSWCNIYSEKQILDLIDDLKTGEYSYVQLSNNHNISYDIVASVARHCSWNYLTEEINFPTPKKSSRENVKLSENDVKNIVNLLLDGYTNKDISEIYNVNVHTISDIRNHKSWNDITNGINFIKSPRNKKYIGLKEKVIETKKNTNLSNIKIAKIFNISPTYVDIAVRNIG